MLSDCTAIVHGLVLLPIPSPNGELTRLVNAYGHLLGDAGGERLLWRPICNPRGTDAVYRRQRTKAMERVDKLCLADFEAGVTESGSEAHYIRGEYLEAVKEFGLRPRDLPVILFLALEPVNARAVLHIDHRMFTNARRRKILGDLLVEDLSEEKVLRHCADGVFTRSGMDELQAYLATVEKKISELARGGSASQTRLDELPARRDGLENAGADAYAFAYDPGGKREPLSERAYEELHKRRNEYDFFIDGMTCRGFKRAEAGQVHQEASLTGAEFNMILFYVTRKGFRLPKTRSGNSTVDPKTARRTLQAARKKVDIKKGGAFTLFAMRRGAPGEPSLYAFNPPEGSTWMVIAPGAGLRSSNGIT